MTIYPPTFSFCRIVRDNTVDNCRTTIPTINSATFLSITINNCKTRYNAILVEVKALMLFCFCAVTVDNAAVRAIFTPNGNIPIYMEIAVAIASIDTISHNHLIAIAAGTNSRINRRIVPRHQTNLC